MHSKKIKYLFPILLIPMAFADNSNSNLPSKKNSESQKNIPLSVLALVRAEYAKKHFEKVVEISDEYLKKYPNDYDVKLFLGLSYYQLKQDNKAEKLFKEILAKYPNYDDARFGLINIYLRQKKIKEAELELGKLRVNSQDTTSIKKYSDKIISLKNYLNNQTKVVKKKKLSHEEIVYKQAGLYYEQGEYKKSLDTLVTINGFKENPKYKKLYNELNRLTNYRYTPLLSFAIGNYTMHYMETGENWTFNHAIFIYSNEKSSYQIGLNQAERNKEKEVQQFIILNPIKNQHVSAYAGFRKSPEAILYPNRTYDYGVTVNFNDAFNGIFEGQFDRIRKTFLRRYVVGVEKYFGDYYFHLKPIYFDPKKGESTILYTFKLVKYYSADNYIGVSIGEGKSPDLADLQTVGFFNINNSYIMFNGQKAIDKKLLLHVGFGYTKQRFPSDRERHFQTGAIGFKYRFI